MQVINWFLRRIFKYLSPIISIFEHRKIKKYSKQEPNSSPVFIIGPPRSGSTILYQLITNFFDVIYIDNLVHLSRNNLFFGFWLSKLLFKNKTHNNFNSDYGNTKKFGLHAPSEGGNIWYRWFNKNEHYFKKDSLSEKKIIQIRENLSAILNKYNKPLVIKNLMFAQRIQVLSQTCPNAKFIVIKRSPEYNAQSIYKARLKQSKHKWWSTEPKNYKELLQLSLIEQAVSQVFLLEKQIHEDLNLFPKGNITIIKYEDLINNGKKTLDKLIKFINTDERIDYSDVKLTSEDEIKIDQKDFNIIVDTINTFDWENYKKRIRMSNKYKIRYLNQTEYLNWNTFVDECADGTIFNKSFWLENLFKNQSKIRFKILGCFDKDSKLIGGFAFGYIKKFSLFNIIVPPSLTPYSGILIKDRPSKYTSKTENYKLNVSDEIINYLNKDFSQVTLIQSPKYRDIRGLIWKKFSEKVKYTYLTTLDDTNSLYESFDPDVKRQIKKLENTNYIINKDDSFETFFNLQEKSFLRQQYSFKLSKKQFFKFLKELDSEKCFKVYTIYEEELPIYSTVILLHKQTAYYWLAGGDPDFFAKGHNKVLLWEIILDLKKQGLTYFDFVGANTPSVSKYKSNFGFELVPYYYLEKTNNKLLKMLLIIKTIIKKS